MTFPELGLSPKVLAAIEAAGYTTPTPIQAKAIPIALKGRDVLGIAQTGTGKTASFVLPMLTRLESGRARARMPRSLILAPTRELAAQVAENFERYGVNHKLSVALLIGGVSFDDQNRKLDRGVDVLIATPGRLLDHFGRGRLLLSAVEILVIDEADRMLDMGFIPDIERICSLLPPRRQTLFFSATMPPEIQRLVDRFLRDPERVEVSPQASTAGTITQRFVYASFDPKLKREALRELIRTQDVKNAIIFCNRKKDVDILYKSLVKHGFNAGCLHGDMDQHTRTATLEAFRSGSIALLAASDVAARGLDIPDVSHVFNYDVPIVAEDYVHRIGRTGRAGRKGYSATIVTDDDFRTLKDIEKLMKSPAEWLGEPPSEEAAAGSLRRRGRRRGRSESSAGGERRGSVPRGGRRPERSRAVATAPAEEVGTGDTASKPRPPHRAERSRPEHVTEQPTVATRRERPPAERSETAHAAESSRRGDRPRRDRAPREHRHAEEPRHAGESRHASEPRHPDEGRRSGGPSRSGGSRHSDDRPIAPVEAESGSSGRAVPIYESRSPSLPFRERRRPARQHRDEGPAAVGLGDHVPDFLKRPTKSVGES